MFHIKTPTLDIEGEVVFATYADGSTALLLDCGDGGPPERLTVCLAGYGVTPPEGHVFVRDYSEHTGMPAALAQAGIAVPVDIETFGQYDGRAVLMRVLV